MWVFGVVAVPGGGDSRCVGAISSTCGGHAARCGLRGCANIFQHVCGMVNREVTVGLGGGHWRGGGALSLVPMPER
jgi:hypothetical protein